MYEVISQLFWDPHGLSHAKNNNTAWLSQGVELSEHKIIMVDTKYEDRDSITSVNLSVLWTIEPTMLVLLDRDE